MKRAQQQPHNSYESIIVTFYKGLCEDQDRSPQCYRTFGEFDCITIQPVENGSGGDAAFQNMWTTARNASRQMAVGVSNYTVYGVRYKESGEDSDPAEFWKQKDYPYLFTSMIQIKRNMDSLDSLRQVAQRFAAFLAEYQGKRGGMLFSIYYSLDSSDLLVFFKTNRYAAGSDIIQDLPLITDQHGENYPHYGYSICGVDLKRLVDSEEEIEKIMLCSVIKDYHLYAQWDRQMKERYPVEAGHSYYSRLGNEDICINLKKCTMGEFARELLDGLLSAKNELYEKGLMRVRIQLDLPLYAPPCTPAEQLEADTMYQKYRRAVKEKHINRHIDPDLEKALCEILGNCSYFEEEQFARDVQSCVVNVFDLFLWELEQFNKHYEKHQPLMLGDYNPYRFNQYVTSFVQGIMSIVNGSLHADRMFFQAPGFNAVLYDIPSKLLVFYTAFLQQFSELLIVREKERMYRFLLCPDLHQITSIETLFEDPRRKTVNRLLKGEVPVQMLFEPKRLLQTLAHEGAHYVGDEIRCREIRTMYSMLMLGEYFAWKLFAGHEDREEFQGVFGEVPDKTLQELRTTIRDYCCRIIQQEVNRSNEKRRGKGQGNGAQPQANHSGEDQDKKLSHYQRNTRLSFWDALVALCSEKCLYDIAGLGEQALLGCKTLNSGSVAAMCQRLELMVRYLKNRQDQLRLDIKLCLDDIHSLTNESFSDLVMCEMFSLSMEDYLRSFFDKYKDQDREFWFLFTGGDGERILSVLAVYNYDLAGELRRRREQGEDFHYTQYLEKLQEFFGEHRLAHHQLPKAVIYNNRDYLLQCRKKLDNYHKELAELKKFYHQATEDSMEESMRTMIDASYRFRAGCLKDQVKPAPSRPFIPN